MIDRKSLAYLSELPEKSQRLIKENCRALAGDPFPGQGWHKELLYLEFKLYRLHVGRSFTVFYQVCEKDGLVKILELRLSTRRTSSTSISKCDALHKSGRTILANRISQSSLKRAKNLMLICSIAAIQGKGKPRRR